jgi:hypothetical protein
MAPKTAKPPHAGGGDAESVNKRNRSLAMN